MTWRGSVCGRPIETRCAQFAAAVALLAVGVAVGVAVGAALASRTAPSLLEQGKTPLAPAASAHAWVQRAIVAHNVYTPEVRHAVEVKAQEAHLARWLTTRLKLQVKLFDLREQGFELVGGRLLPDIAGPSAQLMYQEVIAAADSTRKPLRITLYVRAPEVSTPATFRFEQQGELGMFYWVEGASAEHAACGYALIGALPRDRLLAVAESIFRQQ
jgi:anti-sigma factor RsiW